MEGIGGSWTLKRPSPLAMALGSLACLLAGTMSLGCGDAQFGGREASVDQMGDDWVGLFGKSGLSGWTSLGMPLGETNLDKIAVAPDDDIFLIVGTNNVGHGIYISRDGGRSWIQPAGLPASGPGTFAIDPSNPSYIYASINNSGVFSNYASVDKGRSWNAMKSLGGYASVWQVSAADGTVFALGQTTATNSRQGIFWSKSHGDRWTFSPFWADEMAHPALTFFDLEEDPTNNTLYLGSQYMAHPAGVACTCPLFVSRDRGVTWVDRSASLGKWHWHSTRLQINQATHVVYAFLEGNGIWKSSNFGSTWVYVMNNSFAIWEFVIDPLYPNRMFVSGAQFAPSQGELVFASTDAGRHFKPIGPAKIAKPGIAFLGLNHSSTKLVAAISNYGVYVKDIGAGACLPVENCPNQCRTPEGACYDPDTQVLVTTQAIPEGSGAVDPAACVNSKGTFDTFGVCALNSSAIFYPVSQANFKFIGWRGALSGVASPGTLTLTGNVSVTAHFR